MKRRILAFMLSLAMVAGALPTAFAEEFGQNDEYLVPVNDEEPVIGGDEPTVDDDEPVIGGGDYTFIFADSVELSENEIKLRVDDTYTLKATVTPETTSNSPKWYAEDEAIATVSGNGAIATVTAVTEGTTTITVSIDGKSANCTVIVSNDGGEEPVQHEHVYTSKVTTPATCTEAGVKTFTCVAGDDSYTEPIKPTGHKMMLVFGMEATCTENGYSSSAYCSVCNEVLAEQKVIEAKGHSYTEKVTTEATCTETGVKTFTCKYGDSEYTETIPAKGHTEVAVDATEPTCTEIGLTAGKKCEACGITLEGRETIAALGHDYEIKVTKLPTRFSTGENTHTCKRCGSSYKTEIPKRKLLHWHSYTATVIKEATCAGSGTKLYTCTCGAMYTEDIQHEPNYTAEVIKEPSCSEVGTMLYTCTCGNTYTEQFGSLLEHTEVEIPAVAPTYTKTGLTKGMKCTVCGNIRAQHIVDKLVVEKVRNFKLKRTADGKRLTAQWKAGKNISGYQIRFSTDKEMSTYRNYWIDKAKINSKTVSSIKGKEIKKGRTFYVKIRAYVIEDGKRIYSKWSKLEITI